MDQLVRHGLMTDILDHFVISCRIRWITFEPLEEILQLLERRRSVVGSTMLSSFHINATSCRSPVWRIIFPKISIAFRFSDERMDWVGRRTPKALVSHSRAMSYLISLSCGRKWTWKMFGSLSETSKTLDGTEPATHQQNGVKMSGPISLEEHRSCNVRCAPRTSRPIKTVTSDESIVGKSKSLRWFYSKFTLGQWHFFSRNWSVELP